MTVQELIDALNKVKDKSKEVILFDDLCVTKIEEDNDTVMLY